MLGYSSDGELVGEGRKLFRSVDDLFIDVDATAARLLAGCPRLWPSRRRGVKLSASARSARKDK